MAEAVVDSNVLLGARLKRDQNHERGGEIIRGMDAGELPRGRLTEYNLPEVLTPIEKRGGDGPALETLELITESRGLDVHHTTGDDYTRGLAIYRQEEGIEVVDCIMVAYMRRVGLKYVYSFDDDFDRFADITRLDSATNPFA